MDNTGLLIKFPVNRPITDWEIDRRLLQNRPSGAEPWQQTSIIRMNSTYLECVDKFFESRGIITAISLFGIIIALWMLAIPVLLLIELLSLPPNEWKENILLSIALLIMFVPLLFFTWRFVFRKEAFRFTHYPMRFNRKNQMVYVTRLDGTVMAAPWDSLFFAPGDCGEEIRDIRMHRLAADGATVLETHALSHYSDVHDPNLLSQWEFIRRYMENGPAAFMDDITLVMNVHDRREGLIESFLRIHASSMGRMGFLGYTALPVDLVYSLGRWIANITSKIPQWPEDVERECQIDPDDPYIRDRDNLATQEEFRDAQERRGIS